MADEQRNSSLQSSRAGSLQVSRMLWDGSQSSTASRLQSVQVFRACDTYAETESPSVVQSIVDKLNGTALDLPLYLHSDGRCAVFLGKGNKLYGLGIGHGISCTFPLELTMNTDSDHVEPSSSQETRDLGAVSIRACGEQVLIVTAQLQLMFLYGTTLTQLLPSKHVVQVACGAGHYLALTTTGEVFSCGTNDAGELGSGDFEARNAPAQVELVWAEEPRNRFALNIAAGWDFSVVVCEKEIVFGFGSNSFGQCGSSRGRKNVPVPTAVSFAQSARPLQAACGRYHTVFLCSGGKLFGCGNAEKGQLADRSDSVVVTPVNLAFNSFQHGHPLSVYCHEDASVVLTERDRFHICGTATWFSDASMRLTDFVPYVGDMVMLDGVIVCAKPSLTPKATGRPYPTALDETVSPLVYDLELVSHAQGAPSEPIPAGTQLLHERSSHLSRLLRSGCQGNIERLEDGRLRLNVHDFSAPALRTFVRYLYTDALSTLEAHTLAELVALSDRYLDETGLLDHCLNSLKLFAGSAQSSNEAHSVITTLLHEGFPMLVIWIVRHCLSCKNVCRVLTAVEEFHASRKKQGQPLDPASIYVRELALMFAVEHSSAVMMAELDWKTVVPQSVQSDWLSKLAFLGLIP